jgi:hypothetical protein
LRSGLLIFSESGKQRDLFAFRQAIALGDGALFSSVPIKVAILIVFRPRRIAVPPDVRLRDRNEGRWKVNLAEAIA